MEKNHFILKESGKIHWVENIPEEPLMGICSTEPVVGCFENRPDCKCAAEWKPYKKVLQSSIDNAVEVSNQEEVGELLKPVNIKSPRQRDELEVGKIYSLLCSVQKDTVYLSDSIEDYKRVALVTFKEPSEDDSYNAFKAEIEALSNTKDQPLVREETQLDTTVEALIKEVVAICKEHADEGYFDHEGAEANAIRIFTRKQNTNGN